MGRSAEVGSSGRISPSSRRRSLSWAGALVLVGVCCWLLLAGGYGFGGPGATLGLLTLGGWGLGLLPVHSDRRRTGPESRSVAQPQTARGGVEPGGLQDGTER